MKVLLLEDHDVLRRFLVEEVSSLDEVETFEAATMGEAMALIDEHQFAVILSDINVGGVNVAEQVGTLRSHPNCASSHIILTSAGAPAGLVTQALRNGADDYVDKNVGLAALAVRVHEAIGQHA